MGFRTTGRNVVWRNDLSKPARVVSKPTYLNWDIIYDFCFLINQTAGNLLCAKGNQYSKLVFHCLTSIVAFDVCVAC